MQNKNTASFFAPGFDDSIEQQAIDRQRRMAEVLRAQSQAPLKGQMAGQIYVPPSITEGLAQMFKAYQSGQSESNADAKQRALGAAMQARNQQEAKDFFTTLRGTPAVPATPETQGNNPSAYAPAQEGRAAIPGDQDKAIQMAFSAKSPMVQAYGSKIAEGQLSQQQMQDLMAAALKAAGQGPAGATVPAGGAPGAPGQPAAGPATIGGVNPLAFALTATGNPTLGKIGGMIAEANKPLAAREGDVLVPDGNGGMRSVWSAPKSEPGIQLNRGANGQVVSAGEIPGYGPAAAGIKGATAGATAAANAAQDMVTINTPQGPKMMTRAQAVALSGGGQPPMSQPNPVQPQGRPANPMAPQPEDADRALIYNTELQAAQQRLAQAKTPEEKARAQSDIDGLGREMQRAGVKPQAQVGIPLQDEAAKAFSVERSKDFANQAKTYSDGGAKAASIVATTAALKQLYADPNIAKGGGAALTSGIKNAAATLGIDIKGLGAEQAIESITNKMALDLRSTAEGGGMPGALSDKDRDFLVSMTPGLSKSPEGRALIMEAQERTARRQIEIAKMATAYEQKFGKLDVGFQKQAQDYAYSNPIFNGLSVPQVAAPATGAKHPPAIDSLLKKYSSGGATGSF